MAEYQEVMKQRKRMCEIFDCADCPLSHNNNGIRGVFCNEFIRDHPAKAEAIIMKWAADHPEPVYPSWSEAWAQVFPNAHFITALKQDQCPCIHFFVPALPYEERCKVSCEVCKSRPIPADVAEKLGVKPIEK